MTPNIEPRLEETSFTLSHRTQKPQKTTAPDPQNRRNGIPSPVRLCIAQVLSPLCVGIRNSAMTPDIEPSLEETSLTLPRRTPKPEKATAPDHKKFAQGSHQPSQTMGSPSTLPLWVGIRNSANDPEYRKKAGRDKFHPSAPDPKKLAQGSPQPSQTMGSPGILTLMGGHP